MSWRIIICLALVAGGAVARDTATGQPRLRPPRETIFVIDTSRSMCGRAQTHVNQVLNLALDDLEPHDHFNVINFASVTERFFPAPVTADPRSVETARLWISELVTECGKNMLSALAAALDDQAHGLPRQVILITDGRIENELEVLTYVRDHLETARLFTVGIGVSPNGRFLRRAAELGKGRYMLIADPSDSEHRMAALLQRLAEPAPSGAPEAAIAPIEVFTEELTVIGKRPEPVHVIYAQGGG